MSPNLLAINTHLLLNSIHVVHGCLERHDSFINLDRAAMAENVLTLCNHPPTGQNTDESMKMAVQY